jgi:hypothetical protein
MFISLVIFNSTVTAKDRQMKLETNKGNQVHHIFILESSAKSNHHHPSVSNNPFASQNKKITQKINSQLDILCLNFYALKVLFWPN